MARSIWSGSITFGLVNIPIKLFSATESHRIGFHELEEGTGERIRYKRVAERSGHEVPWKKIHKGFEVGKGRYVMLSDEELAAAAPERARTIEIEQFVSLHDIDPVAWDQTYYVAPAGAAAAKSYALLRKAMADRDRVAIGRFVMRTKEYVVCVRAYENILALATMFFPDEVREVGEVGEVPKAAVGQRELAMAERLIDMLTAPWDPAKYKDTFTARVMDLVRKKAKGQEITVPERADEGPQVVDLMEALKATLAGGGRRPGRTPPSAHDRHARSRSGAQAPPRRTGVRRATRRAGKRRDGKRRPV
jgi:DNA end-binding protein Ku